MENGVFFTATKAPENLDVVDVFVDQEAVTAKFLQHIERLSDEVKKAAPQLHSFYSMDEIVTAIRQFAELPFDSSYLVDLYFDQIIEESGQPSIREIENPEDLDGWLNDSLRSISKAYGKFRLPGDIASNIVASLAYLTNFDDKNNALACLHKLQESSIGTQMLSIFDPYSYPLYTDFENSVASALTAGRHLLRQGRETLETVSKEHILRKYFNGLFNSAIYFKSAQNLFSYALSIIDGNYQQDLMIKTRNNWTEAEESKVAAELALMHYAFPTDHAPCVGIPENFLIFIASNYRLAGGNAVKDILLNLELQNEFPKPIAIIAKGALSILADKKEKRILIAIERVIETMQKNRELRFAAGDPDYVPIACYIAGRMSEAYGEVDQARYHFNQCAGHIDRLNTIFCTQGNS